MARKTWRKVTKETADTVVKMRSEGETFRKIAKYLGRTTAGVTSIWHKLQKNPTLWDHVTTPDEQLEFKRIKPRFDQGYLPVEQSVQRLSKPDTVATLIEKYFSELGIADKIIMIKKYEEFKAISGR